MRIFVAIGVALGLAASTAAMGRSYTPIGDDRLLANRSALVPVKREDRPVLPGVRPVELELLEDALRRKMNVTIGSSREKAQLKIMRNALRDPMKRAQMRGLLAEALFLERNPNWGYVAKANAPQVDVYVFRSGTRKPFGAQIKTHGSGDPLTYAEDMLRDDKADRFLVPDDHVESLRNHWRGQVEQHEAAGRTGEAVEARRQLSRIGGLGFTSQFADDALTRIARFARREQYAGYVSLGAVAGLTLGREIWNGWQEGGLTDDAALRIARGGSNFAAERWVTRAMTRNTSEIPVASAGGMRTRGGRVLRGSLRGNALVGVAVLVVDTSFAMYERGGRRAIHNDAFYAELGGSVSALTVGLAAGQSSAVWTGNPYVAVAVGTAAAAVAGIAGQEVTARTIRILNEKHIRARDEAIFKEVNADIDRRLNALRVPSELPRTRT